MSAPLRVAMWLGIGDCHWACTKLRGLAERHGGRPVHAYVGTSPSHATVEYLRMVEPIQQAFQSDRAPWDLARDLSPHWRDPRWSTLDGCAGWRGFDYVLVPNGHLECGLPLEGWLPDLPTDFAYALRVPGPSRRLAESLVEPGDVLLYLSGNGPNRGFHNETWTVEMWARTMELFNAVGIVPVLIGANTADDRGYRDRVAGAARGRARFRDIVGRTTIPDIVAVTDRAGVWVGLNSGTGIVAASRGTPTVMLWSDSRFPIPGAVEPLHTHMQTSWLTPAQRKTYRTLSYGSPSLAPARVVARALEVIRR
jgi:hypothetical protein